VREFAGTPTLRSLAKEIVSAFEASQVVFVQFPTQSHYGNWIDSILAACDDELVLRSQGLLGLQHFNGADGVLSPTTLLTQLTHGDNTSLEGFVSDFGEDPIHLSFAQLGEGSPLPDNWASFLEAIVKCMKASDAGDKSRYLLISLTAPVLPRGLEGLGSKLYQLWNPITWEELRIVASGMLGPDPSEVTRAWMISTYTGACCWNPKLLRTLCIERPKTLALTMKSVLDEVPLGHQGNEHATDAMLGGNWRPWAVPETCNAQWSSGIQIGRTIDRGCMGIPEGQTNSEREASLSRHIWREQVSGLFPMIAELSTQSLRLTDSWLKGQWREGLATFANTTHDEVIFLEPSTVLAFLRDEPHLSRKLPTTILSLLNTLREIRNGIAHLKPVDLNRLTTLWDLYSRAQSNCR
jgi:hypothetical protein